MLDSAKKRKGCVVCYAFILFYILEKACFNYGVGYLCQLCSREMEQFQTRWENGDHGAACKIVRLLKEK